MTDVSLADRSSRGRQPVPPRVVIPCNLRAEQANALRKLSQRLDVPCSILIRQAVDHLLTEADRNGDAQLALVREEVARDR